MRSRAYTIVLVVLFAVTLIGCASTGAEQDDEAEEARAEEKEEEPSEADRLAKRIAERTGDPYDVDEIAFSFVVGHDDETTERRHVWRPRDQQVTVTYNDMTVELREIGEHDLSRFAAAPDVHEEEWEEVAPDASPKEAAQAWSHFVNDSFWLLAPAKLFDEGVNRALDPDDQSRLIMTFDDVGLTPGDRYSLLVDRDEARLDGWEFILEDGTTGSYRWTDYEEFGPLYLSTRRTARQGDADIRFEEIEVEP